MRVLVAIVLLAGCRVRFDERSDASGDAITLDAPADITSVMPDGDDDCPSTYAMVTGLTSRYRTIAGSTTWLQAEAACEADGTHLIVINNTAENNYAQSLNATAMEHVWLGGGDFRVEDTFEWITGEPMTFTRWGSTEPNNSMNIEDVMEIDDNGLWNDERNAGIDTYHTVCECDGIEVVVARYCDTDANENCGTCGNACPGGMTCVNQACQ